MSPSSPRLLVIVNVFHPDLGGGVLFSDLCYGLAARGFDVTVRCAYPYYPEWRDKTGNNGLRVSRYEDHGVHVERLGLYIPSNPNALSQRLLYEASFFLSLLRRRPRRHEFDLVMVYCPLIGAVAYGGLLRWINGGPLWLNVQDLSADAAAASGISKGGLVTRLLAATQNTLFNRATVWSSISPVMVERLETLAVHDQPVLYMPHWLHASLADAIAAQPDKRGRAPRTPIRLLYSGNIGTKQDLLLFCQRLQASDVRFAFRIQGGGGRADEVRQWVEQAGDPRFSFHPLSDEAGLAKALHDADLFVITEKSGIGGAFIPSKLIPGMVSGTPILAVCDATSPLGREMAEAQPGLHLTWDALGTLPQHLQTMQSDPRAFLQWQSQALERAQFYDRTHQIDRYAKALRACLSRNPDALSAFTLRTSAP